MGCLFCLSNSVWIWKRDFCCILKSIKFDYMWKGTIIFFAIIFVLLGCKSRVSKTDRAFYYWKTTYHVSSGQTALLKELRIKKLYLRFFDVDWGEAYNRNIPVAQVIFQAPVDTFLDVVPVVYITNKALKKESADGMPALAENIFKQVNSIAKPQHILFNELQIDCDWTESTRGKYFLLIDLLKEKLHSAHKTISATIRLHQVKYPKKTGIPSVDRGMLMFYNIGKINGTDEINSIYNEADANKYISAISDYSLPLDVVLPVFSWAVHIRDHKVIGLLNKTTSANLNLPNFTPISKISYRADTSFFFHGHYIMKNDVLKMEEISPELSRNAAEKISGKLKSEHGSIAIFDLDSINISRYEQKDFEEIFDSFN